METVMEIVHNAIDAESFYSEWSKWAHHWKIFKMVSIIDNILSYVAVVCELLILWILFRQSKMRSTWYTLTLYNMHLMRWIFKVLPLRNEVFETIYVQFCIMENFQRLTKFCTMLTILVILRNTIVRRKTVSDVTLIMLIYFYLIIAAVVEGMLCDGDVESFWLFPFTFLGLFILFFLYELYMAFIIYVRKHLISRETRIQINICRFFVYTHVFTFIAFLCDSLVFGLIAQLTELLIPSIGILNFLYLLCADGNFWVSFKNAIRCGNAQEVDRQIVICDEEDRQTIEGNLWNES